MSENSAEFRNGYLLAMEQTQSLQNTVRHLAESVNQQVMLMFAICKKLGTTPQALIESLTTEDFLNPSDTPNAGTIIN